MMPAEVRLGGLLLAVALAWGQEVPEPPVWNAQLYRPSIDATRTLWVDDATSAPSGYGRARVGVNYMNGPMGYAFDDGTQVQVIRDVVGLDLATGLNAGPIRFGIAVPVFALATSDIEGAGGAGLGDVAVDVKGTLLDPEDTGVGVAAFTRVSAPTGTVNLPLRSEGLVWEAGLIAEKRMGAGFLLANLGTRGAPAVQAENLDLKSAFTYRLAGGWAPDERGGLALEVAGIASYQGGDRAGYPLEALATGWFRAGPIVVRGGGGTGLVAGVGAPVVRGVLQLGYEPIAAKDSDLDGLVDRADQCPEEPEDADGWEDADGCPDPDDDGDGKLDAADACPREAEDADGYRDDDGCPDPLTLAKVRVVDGDGRLAAGVSLVLTQAGQADVQGKGRIEAELQPGAWTYTTTSEDYEPATGELTVPAGPPQELVVKVKAVAKLGVVSVRLRDGARAPLNGTVRVGEVELPISGGEGELALAPGEYPLVASAKGFFPVEMPIEVVRGDTTPVLIIMDPAPGALKLKVIGPDGGPVPSAFWAASDGQAAGVDGNGLVEVSFGAGTYDLMVSAEGYLGQTLPLVLEGGDVRELVVQLDAPRVVVTRERIDISETVYFETNKSVIKPDSYGLLDEVAGVLLEHPEILRVRIEGHTDSRGSDAANLKLSDSRAAAVRTYLIEKGVAAERLTSVGYGESKPIAEGNDEAAWSRNRRVDFFIEAQAE